MELVKKNIHTERLKSKALLQIPLEEDMNVSDTRPDVSKLVFTRGKIKIDELKTGTNKVWAKGRLVYQILYLAEGKDAGLAGMEGEIGFMEEIYMDMVESGDRATCTTDLEDIRVNMINSRKLSIQAVVTLMPRVEETVEEEICTALTGEGGTQGKEVKQLEYRQKALDYLETAVSKRDLFRIHEENKLPGQMPAIGTVVWKSANISHVNFRPLAEKIAVVGEISLFLIYTEDVSGRPDWYETTIPFSGNVECQGCEETMVADISYDVGHEEITVREDGDGEARMISVELALELELKLLKKETAPIVADVYGVSCEVAAVTSPKQFRHLQQDMYLEEKIGGSIKPEGMDAKILQICHSESRLEIENCVFGDEELEIQGNVALRILYLSNEEGAGFATAESSLPFMITRKISGLRQGMEYSPESCSLHPVLEQLHVSIKDGDRMEWQGVLSLHLMLYDEEREDILVELKIGELDSSKLEKLPGFAIYFVKEGDTLWQIGRKYYVSVDKIKEVNQLTGEEIKAGDRLLIVKSGEI